MQTICMKCQNLLSWENSQKKKKIQNLSAEINNNNKKKHHEVMNKPLKC